MSSASEYEEWFKTWPTLCYGLYRVIDDEMVIDAWHTLGMNLFLAGALATASKAALQAGIDLGIDLGVELVAKEMQDDAMRSATRKPQSIIAPSRQLILPGIK